MSAKTNSYAQSLLKLIFNGTTYSNLAINATSSPFTSLYVSLHTANPGSTGNQSTNEATYSGYARQVVARNNTGWIITSNSVSPASNIVFPSATGGSETETYFGIGTSSTGTGQLLYFGQLNPTINVSTGVIPEISTSSTIIEL